MADVIPITVSLYGFVKDQESPLQSAFDNADKWPIPWTLTHSVESARVVIVDLPSENDYAVIDNLKREQPMSEIVAFSSIKPPQAKWHLVKQAGGKLSIVGFSHLVLKISHSIKKGLTDTRQTPAITETRVEGSSRVTENERVSVSEDDDFDQESIEFLSFFDTLDSVIENKPIEKRKRFNES